MKKNILMGAAVCCLWATPMSGVAQTVETNDYRVNTGRILTTTKVYDDKFMETAYTGNDLHAGRLTFGTWILLTKKGDGKINVPENASIRLKLTDAYGRNIVDKTNTSDYLELIKVLVGLKDNGHNGGVINFPHIIMRGGEYNLQWDYSFVDIHGDSVLVIKDEPCARVRFGEKMTVVGQDIKLTTVYNTGYPFDMTKFTGMEKADLKLYSIIPDEQGNAVLNELTSSSKALNLYRPDEPKMAAMDSLELTYEKPQPGAYLLRMSSDCQLPNANRDFTFSVNDTLRAKVTPTQTTYKTAVEPALKYHLTMNYGYPYIQPSGNDKVPAVYVITNILKPQENEWMDPDTLMSGVSKIEGAELAKQTLDWNGDIEVKGLEQQANAPTKRTELVAEVIVFFNDQKQYRTTIPFTYLPGEGHETETDDYSFKFRQNIYTETTYDELFHPENYTGNELRAGVINYKWGVRAGKKKNDAVIIAPEKANIDITLTDAYGREAFRRVDSEIITGIFKTMKMSRMEIADAIPLRVQVFRGGQYNLSWNIPYFSQYNDSTIIIKDDPSVRLLFGEEMNIVGHDIDMWAFYNTGYPFDMTKFSGTEQAKITLFSVTPDEQGNAVFNELTSSSKILNLYHSNEPLVAAMDSLELKYEKPEPGEYLLKMTSECELPNANREFSFSVNDTLRANVNTAQTVYNAATDRALRYHLAMNYRYPYVQPSGNDKVPAVYVITNILKPQEDEWMDSDTLMSGVSKIEGAELAKQTLNWEGDIEVKGLETQDTAPAAETDLVAEVVIFFNDKVQYRTNIPFTYIPFTTGIRNAETTAGANAKAAWYDLQGRSLNGRPVSKGIYVHDGVKVVNK